MELILGIDVACRAAHQASLARPDGTFVWTGRRFFTRPDELEKLWTACGLKKRDTVRIIMEPTRNAWAPLASWFRHRGARVSMVPTTQSADLRAYYSKHAKNDHLDSKMLARLPLLHPKDCAITPAAARLSHCAGSSKSDHPSSNAAPRSFNASMPNWSCSARPGTTP
nr:IS110 family transposase [Mycolicibacterium tokaiense]